MATTKLTDRSINQKPPAAGQIELWDTVVPGFGLRISYGGKRTYFVMTRVHGRQVRRTVGSTVTHRLSEARDDARDILKEAAKGIDAASPEARRAAAEEARRAAERAEERSFRKVAEEFMVDRAKNLKTKDEYQRKLDKDILPAWGGRHIAEITRADVKALLRAKAAESPVAANRLAALIKTIFNWAIDEDIIATSPAARIKKEDETPRDRVLTDGEIRDVWNGAVALGYPFGHLVRFLLLTGQRRAEAGGLVWSEIEGDSWRLPSERTKTGTGHLVPLSETARAALAECPRYADIDHVFTPLRGRLKKDEQDDGSKHADQPLSGWSKFKRRLDDKITEARREAAKKAGADPAKVKPLPRWTLHDLRRTCATGLQSLKVADDVIDKVLNHALPGVRRHYNHFARDEQKAMALEAWGNHIEALVSGEPMPSNVRALRAGA